MHRLAAVRLQESGDQTRWRQRWPWRRPRRIGLVSEDLLDLADLFLDLTFDLFRLAVGLEPAVSNRLAGDFLDATGDVLGGALYFILSAWFHFFVFV